MLLDVGFDLSRVVVDDSRFSGSEWLDTLLILARACYSLCIVLPCSLLGGWCRIVRPAIVV